MNSNLFAALIMLFFIIGSCLNMAMEGRKFLDANFDLKRRDVSGIGHDGIDDSNNGIFLSKRFCRKRRMAFFRRVPFFSKAQAGKIDHKIFLTLKIFLINE